MIKIKKNDTYNQIRAIGESLYTKWFLVGGEHCSSRGGGIRFTRWNKMAILIRAEDNLRKLI